MFNKKVFCLVFITVVLSEAGKLKNDFFKKCSIKDSECQMLVFHTAVEKYGHIGIPELGIPPMEPYKVEDTTVSILGMVNLTMVDGQIDGMTNCAFTKFETNIDKRYTISESFCEQIKISGHYTIVPGPLYQSITSNSVSGDGNGKIQIDKMTLKVKIPFEVEKDEETDEIYLIPNTSEAHYSTEDIENISFGADNIMVGNREISEQVTTFMNNNWRPILKSFGKFFSDRIMDVFYEYLLKFFRVIPARKYITDDLSAYVTNN